MMIYKHIKKANLMKDGNDKLKIHNIEGRFLFFSMN